MSANAAAARAPSAVTIRPLTVADASALKACRVAGLQETPEAFLSTAAEIEATPVAQFEAELADADIRYAGAFDGEGLVGFMRTVRFSRRARRHVAEVRSVVVRASHRRQGIADRLLSHLIAQARDSGIEALLLTNDRLIASGARDAGLEAAEAGLIKTVAAENAIAVVQEAVALCGNHALARSNPLERHLRDVLCARIHTPQPDSAYGVAGRRALGVN